MVTPLIKYCQSISEISLEFIELIREHATMMDFTPYSNLTKVMSDNPGVFFVLNGCVRSFVIDDGKEVTTDFFRHAEIFGSRARLSSPTQAPCQFETLTHTDVIFLNYPLIEKLYSRCPEASPIAFKILQDKYLHLSRMAALSKITAAARRYTLFRELAEDLETIPKYYLASFLGMRYETLSRLSAKFKRDNPEVN